MKTLNKAILCYKKFKNKLDIQEAYILSEDDLDHKCRIFKKLDIIPESLDYVRIDFVLQTTELIRYVIKEFDLLLKIGGCFEINIINSKGHSIYYRSRDQIKYEFSISTNSRYKLSLISDKGNNGVLSLKYTKFEAALVKNDSIESWSFGIITNGKKLESLFKLVESIRRQDIPNCEIIICGPLSYKEFIEEYNLIILDDVVLLDDCRVPTPHKKNRIIEKASYNNLVLLHDRFTLPNSWFQKMIEYGNYFDYLLLKTIDVMGNRFNVDWMTFDSNISSKISNKNISLNYNQWSNDLIIQGGVIVGKKNIIEKHLLDERLYWEELEDIHFSKMAMLNGAFFSLDVNNYFISESVNHIPNKARRRIYKIELLIKWIFSLFKNYLKFNYILFIQYKKMKNNVQK